MNQARKERKLRLADIPHFPMPQDSKPRTGFVNPDVFNQLRAAMPKHLHLLITFLYYTGCRIGAAKLITWAMVSKDCKELELPGEITKNGEPLTLPLVGKGLEQVSTMLKKQFRKDGPVFDATNLRKEWAAACHKLGLGVKDGWRYQGLKIHDLRRSAVRNLVRAGVREDVDMTISGHKTREVFSRYNITDATDIHEALIKGWSVCQDSNAEVTLCVAAYLAAYHGSVLDISLAHDFPPLAPQSQHPEAEQPGGEQEEIRGLRDSAGSEACNPYVVA